MTVPAGPTKIALQDAAYGLARYGAISQAAGLVPIIEPEVLLDGDHDIDRTLEVAEEIWAETFKYMADQVREWRKKRGVVEKKINFLIDSFNLFSSPPHPQNHSGRHL